MRFVRFNMHLITQYLRYNCAKVNEFVAFRPRNSRNANALFQNCTVGYSRHLNTRYWNTDDRQVQEV